MKVHVLKKPNFEIGLFKTVMKVQFHFKMAKTMIACFENSPILNRLFKIRMKVYVLKIPFFKMGLFKIRVKVEFHSKITNNKEKFTHTT